MSEFITLSDVIKFVDVLGKNKDIVVSSALIVGGMVCIALTRRQKQWILTRDNNTSQMRHYSEEKGWHCKDPTTCEGCDGKGCPRHVHHINPQGNGGSNRPNNLITLFSCEHIGRKGNGDTVDPEKEFVVHPDNIRALKEYRAGNKDAYNELMDERSEKTKRGEPYWSTDHDIEMAQTAEERTNNEVAKGKKFTKKK